MGGVETGCRVFGSNTDSIDLLVQMATHSDDTTNYPIEFKHDVRVLGMTMLINLTEHNVQNRKVCVSVSE